MGLIRVGTSSWADRRLTGSGWYPRRVDTPAARLAHYAGHFDIVQADTTFYAIPAVETTTAWADATPDGFTFDVTALSVFTNHPIRVTSLPADLRPAGAPDRVRRDDLPAGTWGQLWERFHEALAPLVDAGRLGAVVLRFPGWFARSDAGRRRILATAAECAPLRVVVELPNRTWYEGPQALETLKFLQANDLAYCCVDGPPGPETAPSIQVATAEPGMIRLESHPQKGWATGDKRGLFRHAYPDAELQRWATRLTDLAAEVDELHVLLDNCCADHGPRDAERLLAALSRGPHARATASGSARAR